jgi:hypothetical protein
MDRVFEYPKNVTAEVLTKDGLREADVVFRHFVRDVIADRRFGSTAERLEMAEAILDAERVGRTSGQVRWRSAEWELFREVMEKPQEGWLPAVAVHYLPFIRAVRAAKEDPGA